MGKADRQKLRENRLFAFFRSFVLTERLAQATSGKVEDYLGD